MKKNQERVKNCGNCGNPDHLPDASKMVKTCKQALTKPAEPVRNQAVVRKSRQTECYSQIANN